LQCCWKTFFRQQRRGKLEGFKALEGRKTAVWSPTPFCTLDCGYCFGKRNEKPLTTSQAKRLIQAIAKTDAVLLVFSDGEPLLRKDVFELAVHAKKLGLKTALHTNATLLDNKALAQLSSRDFFDQVNIPLDSVNKQINDLLRPHSFTKAVKAIKALGNQDKIKLTVSTVFCKQNASTLIETAAFLSRFKLEWRIFEFAPRASAALNAKRFMASRKKFEEAIKKTVNHFPLLPLKPIKNDDPSFNASYYIVSPRGKIFCPIGRTEVMVGHWRTTNDKPSFSLPTCLKIAA